MCLRIWVPLLLLACSSYRHNSHLSLDDLRQAFLRPEYQPDFDGWGAARRRRLLIQFFVTQGHGVTTQAEPFRNIHPPDKYRLTHLQVGSGNTQGANRPVKSVTYALVHSGTLPPDPLQRQCDERLFDALATRGRTAQLQESLRFTMDTECRGGASSMD